MRRINKPMKLCRQRSAHTKRRHITLYHKTHTRTTAPRARNLTAAVRTKNLGIIDLAGNHLVRWSIWNVTYPTPSSRKMLWLSISHGNACKDCRNSKTSCPGVDAIAMNHIRQVLCHMLKASCLGLITAHLSILARSATYPTGHGGRACLPRA